VKIAVDAMGGDFAPLEVVKGALEAAMEYGISVILVGDEKQLRAELDKYDAGGLVSVVHTSEVIGMGEPPAVAVRRKKDSSIVRATQLVRRGDDRCPALPGED
jgi:glycerol-3-phosphate acyltransferase PlsX